MRLRRLLQISQPLALALGTQSVVATPIVMNEEEGSQLEREMLGELPSVRAFLGKLLSGRRDVEVEDLVQETVARALRYRASFDPRHSLGPWLRRTAFRVFLDHGGTATPSSPGEAIEPEAPRSELDGCVETREALEHILRSLQGVERDILVRFHRDEQPLSEIATVLGLPIGTVKSHLHRARKRLATEELG